VRFDRRVLGILCFARHFNNLVRFAEPLIHIPYVNVDVSHDIPSRIINARRVRFIMDDGCPILPRFVHRQHSRKFFVLHPNGLDGRIGDGLRVGSHSGYSIADEPHLVLKHPRVVGRRLGVSLPGGRMPDGRRILVCENASHTRDGLGRRCVNRSDSRMSIQAAQDLDVQGIGKFQIGNELRLACH